MKITIAGCEMILQAFKDWLWRMLHPRAIQCDLNREIIRQAQVVRGRARR